MFRRSSTSGGSRGRIRSYGPRNLPDEFPNNNLQDQIRSKLFAKIESCYGRFKRETVVEAGFCFGLLDPVTNILVNTLIPVAFREDDPDCKALARLPKDELRSRFHQSMLKAGHCYGPLDPVSNIILNTIWYDAAYPESRETTIDMISTKSLLRIAVRSFYGLVSFLCTRYNSLTPDLAMRRLQAAGADLLIADPNLHATSDAMREDNQQSCSSCYPGCGRIDAYEAKRRSVEENTPSASAEEAYAAAANAALHPNPHAQQELLRSCNVLLKPASKVLLDGRRLSSKDVEFLSSILPYSSSIQWSHQQQQPVVNGLNKWAYAVVAERRNMFWDQHARVLRRVQAALDLYSRQPGVPKYELDVICGVNEHVSGPEYTRARIARGSHLRTPYMYHHSHINFLATCKDHQSAGAPAVLFFAECSNDGTEEGDFCCPVSLPPPDAGLVRCLYCEHQGTRIVHPAIMNFYGRGIEFEKVLCGERLHGLQFYTNDGIIRNSSEATYWVDGLEDDCVYTVDYVVDDDKDKVDHFVDLLDNLVF